MMFIVFTQGPIKAILLSRSNQSDKIKKKQARLLSDEFKSSCHELMDGLVAGSRNMIGIGVATATAGIIVGAVTLTGIGLVMTEFVEFVSGGNVLLMLLFTAAISLLLGMGLPTTANYIVVSTLMAPVIVTLGAESGLIVPLIAVHLFVFYFGILADDTPPVGLAAFAAAAIAKSNPIQTGIQGFTYDIRTAILPFMFIFNTQLLLIGIENLWSLLFVIFGATIAMLTFAAATQGFWLVKSKLWESIALCLVAFVLFRPGFFWDMIFPEYYSASATQIESIAEKVPENKSLRFVVEGENLDGKHVKKTVELPLISKGSGSNRLKDAGMEISTRDDRVTLTNVVFGSLAQKMGLDLDWEIKYIEILSQRPPKHLMFLPALFLLGFIALLQKRRKKETL